MIRNDTNESYQYIFPCLSLYCVPKKNVGYYFDVAHQLIIYQVRETLQISFSRKFLILVSNQFPYEYRQNKDGWKINLT